MEKISRIACYFQWIKAGFRYEPKSNVDEFKKIENNNEKSKKLCLILEKILLWENSINSIFTIILFNLFFWGMIVLEIRGFAVVSSATLILILCYSALEAHVENDENIGESRISSTDKIDKIINKVKLTYEDLKKLRRNQPGVFCTGVCIASVILWLIGRAFSGIFLTYTLCMTILLAPALLLRIPGKIFPSKEWDNEIDEFLPAATEDDLEVLKRAGDDGDHSPTPTSGSSEFRNDPFNDDELIGLKMPSHDDGSTDGLELGELELTGDNDVADIKMQSQHFERSSSSDDDIELEIKNRDLPSQSDDSESEFEIIDSHEINYFNKL